jgi:hypothetical protein
MSPRPSASERARLAALALLTTACVLGAACRQNVMLDSAETGGAGSGGDGGGTAGAGATFDGGAGGDHTGGAAFGGSRFDGGRTDGFPFCQVQSLPIDMRSPFVIVSVDRSSDMQTWFGTGTRLDVIQQQVQALVSKYRVVKFGYQEFPSSTGMCSNGQGCCAGDIALPSYNSLRAIRGIIHACDSGGAACNQAQRPIANALSKCFDAYKNLYSPGDSGHRYVILLTSGDPSCMSDPMSTSTPCDDSVAQVTKLSNTFTNTAVFGVGDGSESPCLDKLALYGGINSHIVKNPGDLSSALDNMVDTIAAEACKIDIRSAPPDPRTVQLLFDSIPVPNDPLDGWTFDQGTTVTLTVHGTYCQMLEQNVSHVELVAGCALPHN